jgi:hypothetical protein
MFGLDKLTFKIKVILISVIVIVISMGVVYLKNEYSITVVKIDDWVFITSTEEGNYYYKANLVNVDDPTHSITVWIKTVYTDKGKQEFLRKHKENKYKDITRSLSKVLINYKNMEYNESRAIYYSQSDNIIGSDDLSEKSDDVIPKSVGDKLLIKILAHLRLIFDSW